jgi:4-amino-4-deoxy-L-arabinose transferase-like glycosyltransferase
MIQQESSHINRWSRNEIIAAVALLLFASVVRLWNLEADPPLRLSYSNDVYSDAALYTFYAREYVQTGQFSPVEDERFGIFLKSTVTPVAVAVFSLCGVGLWQSNLVGVLYALGALFCFYLFMRRIAGVGASLWFLLLAGLSYNLVFFGRQPFLEHAMAFWAFLALTLVTYGRRMWVFTAAGLFLGVAALFSKIHGLIFVFPFGCFLVWRTLFDDPRLPKLTKRHVSYFGAGYLAAVALWLFISYLPAPDQITSFFQENTVDLHGAPKGLTSVSDFIEKLLTFGYDTNLFPRMVVIGLLGAVFLGAVAYQLCRRESYRTGLNFGNAGHFFVAAMMLSFYLSLMIWNYRPLRYQLILIYPFCAGAAILLARLWSGWRPPSGDRIPLLFWPFCAAIAVIPAYQIFAGSSKLISTNWWNDVSKIAVPLSAPFIAAVVGLIVVAAKRRRFRSAPLFTRGLAVLLACGGLFGSLVGYIDWAGRSACTVRDVNRDVALNVGAGALVTGPYAQSMTLENDLPALIHMFGTARPDPALFQHFPVTHLLLDDGNIARMSEDYPKVMELHEHICTYFIGETKVRLINIAAATGNPIAARYERTPLEQAIIGLRNGDTSVAWHSVQAFTAQHPLNIAGNLLLFEMANADGQYETAETALKKAVEFSPTSYVLNARLGRFYRDRARALGSGELHERAARYYEEAVHLAPTAERTVDEYLKFKDDRTWQNSVDTTS